MRARMSSDGGEPFGTVAGLGGSLALARGTDGGDRGQGDDFHGVASPIPPRVLLDEGLREIIFGRDVRFCKILLPCGNSCACRSGFG